MNRIFFSIFTSIFLMAFVEEPAFAGCEAWLRALSRIQRVEWRLRQAVDEKDYRLALEKALWLLSIERGDLATRDFARHLRFVNSLSRSLRGPHRKEAAPDLLFSLDFYLSESVKFGLWVLGPNFIQILTPNRMIPEISSRDLEIFLRGKRFADADVNAILALESEYSRKKKLPLRAYGALKRWGPSLTAILIALLFGSPLEDWAKSKVKTIPEVQILHSLEACERLDPHGKKIRVLVDSDMVVDARYSRPSDLRGVLSPEVVESTILYLNSIGKNFEAVSIHNPKEFLKELKKSDRAEILVIEGHGEPGDLKIGGLLLSEYLPKIKSPFLPEGTVILFSSCLFADRKYAGEPLSDETMVKFLNATVTANGLSVGSLNISTFQCADLGSECVTGVSSDGAERVIPPISPWARYKAHGLKLLEAVTGAGTMQALLYAFQSGRTSFGAERGFRVYDQARNEASVTEVRENPRYDIELSSYVYEVEKIYQKEKDPKKRESFLKQAGQNFDALLRNIPADPLQLPTKK
jgi:hypothetical protein